MKRLAILAALAAAATSGASASLADDAGRVQALIAQSRTALGGEALDRRGVLEVNAAATLGGLAGTQTSWLEIGGRRFADTEEAAGFSQSGGYDGRAVWGRDGSGVVWVIGGEAARAQTISLGFVDGYGLWRPGRGGATVTWGGANADAGRDYDILKVVAPGSAAPFELWFDAKSHLPARFVQRIGPGALIRTYADYRPFQGIMAPYRTHTTDLNGNETDVEVVSVAFATGDVAARLARPPSDVHDCSIQGGRGETSVPMELIDNHVYVPVTLNGKGPYRFIFDTGGENVVDPAVAAEIGAVGRGELQGGGAGAATQSLSLAKVGSLGVGEAVVKDQLFAVAPVRQGFGVAAGEPVDGIIGFEVLARFVTTFDYAGRKVVLALSGAERPAGGAKVPFVFSDTQPQFACEMNRVAGQCTLDTGARDSIGFYGPFVAAHTQVKAAQLTAVGVNGFGFGGPSFGRLGRLTTLRIGPFTLHHLVADYTADEKGAFAAPFVAANVGGKVWRRFTLTLDYRGQTMTLAPNADFAAADDVEHAGLFLIDHDGKHLVIDVRPGTPAAEAGVAKGDTLESLDGAPASSLSLRAIRQRFSDEPGTTLSLGLVGKDGARRTAVLKLRPFV